VTLTAAPGESGRAQRANSESIRVPRIAGINTFKGESYHTAAWPRDPNGFGPAKLDFSNKRVAVIGVGSTGVQVIQEMAKVARQLTVFLLEPNWCTPLGNGPMTPERMGYIKSHYNEFTAKCDASLAGFPHEFIPQNLFDVPKEERDGLIASEPDKFMLPRQTDMRYNWVHVRLDAIDLVELREIVIDAWRMCVPKSVAAKQLGVNR